MHEYASKHDDSSYTTRVCYVLLEGDRCVQVAEMYRGDAEQVMQGYDTLIPYEVELYGTEGDAYYIMRLDAPNGRPSVGELLSYGATPLS